MPPSKEPLMVMALVAVVTVPEALGRVVVTAVVAARPAMLTKVVVPLLGRPSAMDAKGTRARRARWYCMAMAGFL